MSWLKDPEVLARVQNLALPFNRDGVDPFGVSKKNIGQWLSLLSLSLIHISEPNETREDLVCRLLLANNWDNSSHTFVSLSTIQQSAGFLWL